jgi:hypothetical protein
VPIFSVLGIGCAVDAGAPETGELARAETVIEEPEPWADVSWFPHVATGFTVDFSTSWQGLCELLWEYPCQLQPYRVEIACEGLECDVLDEDLAFEGSGSVDVALIGTGAGRFRVTLIHEETGERAEFTGAPFEIHEPDRVAIECWLGEEEDPPGQCAMPRTRPTQTGSPAGTLVRVFVRLMAGEHELVHPRSILVETNDESFDEYYRDAHYIDPERYPRGSWHSIRHHRLGEPGLSIEARYDQLESSLFVPVNSWVPGPIDQRHQRE